AAFEVRYLAGPLEGVAGLHECLPGGLSEVTLEVRHLGALPGAELTIRDNAEDRAELLVLPLLVVAQSVDALERNLDVRFRSWQRGAGSSHRLGINRRLGACTGHAARVERHIL